MTRLSVLLITYNHEKFITKAIDSILMQRNCENFEIIVCDDHSTDGTLNIVKRKLEGLPNAKIISNEKNLGITKNYQSAFAKCSGEYVFVLEGDDYWIDPLKIKTQTDFLDQYSECSSCSHFYFTEKEGNDALMPPALKREEPYTFFDTNQIILDPFIGNNFSTCCYRNSALKEISAKTYDVISYEWMINISISQFGKTAVINKPMSVYRISGLGAWGKLTETEQIIGTINILPQYDAILDHKYHESFEKKIDLLKNQLKLLNRQSSMPKKFWLQNFFLQKLLNKPAQ